MSYTREVVQDNCFGSLPKSVFPAEVLVDRYIESPSATRTSSTFVAASGEFCLFFATFL